jgi:hypothetical protein
VTSRFRTEGTKKVGGATLAPINSLLDQELLRTLETYRNAVAGRYYAVSSAEIGSRIGGGPWWVSTKLDGELWFVVRFEDEALLVAPNGRVLTGDLDILAAAASLPTGSVLAGELYVVPDGRRGRVGDVAQALGAGAAAGPLRFAAFDVVDAVGLTALSPFDERLAFLREHLPAEGPLHVAPVTDADSTAAISEAYSSTVESDGAEGVVVRASDGRTYKVKPTADIDGVVIAYTERHAEGSGLEVRSILVALAHPSGGWVPLTSVGNVGDAAARRSLHERLHPTQRQSSFRQATDGIIYRFVEPTMVVELRVGDIQAEDARGRRTRQPRLEFDPAAGWRATGLVESPSAVSPVLQRIRDDKLPTLRDVGWEQVEPFLSAPDPDAPTELGTSEVLRREVWVKRGSEKTDVRKLLVWKTNKEAGGKYPAYVVHWTDYSSTRKSPLNREVRLAPTEAEAQRLADAMVADNIKKGWESVG